MIEIMIVVVILGVMMAVAVPSMSGMNRKNKLRGAAREVVALSKAARAEAVFGERTTELIIDLEKHRFWLDLRKPEEDKRKGTITSAKPGTKKGGKSLLEETRHLDEKGLSFGEVVAYDENILKDKLVAIDFYPDGTASPTMLSLKNTKGDAITIEILKATGFAEVTPGTVEEKQAQIAEAAEASPAPPSRGMAGEI